MKKIILNFCALFLFGNALLAQVQLVKDVNTTAAINSGYPGGFINIGGTIYFSVNDGSNGSELWKSDGTIGGTVMVKDICPGSTGGSPGYFVNMGGILYFAATDGSTGSELWKSDGTTSGTVLVKDIYSGPSGSGPYGLTVMNSMLYFQAGDATNGTELWKSDGTAAGTVMVKDINPGSGSSTPYYITAMGNTLYFAAYDAASGYELWKSDGSALGTAQVKDICPGSTSSGTQSFVMVGASIYFIANDGTNGAELWKTNGTGVGTSMIKDIYPGANGGLSSGNLVVYNSALAFMANNGINGTELWTSNGTSVGTTMVKDINPGAPSGVMGTPVISNNILYFPADNNVSGTELWISDGTSGGTGLVKDIFVGATGSNIYWSASTDINGTLYFSADDGATGRELWRSDGTVGGTSLIKDIYIGTTASFPNYFVAGSGFTLFQADNGVNGVELWKSDGSTGGTLMLKNVWPDVSDSYIDLIIASGTNVFFSANEPASGTELWISNGTTVGTQVVKDIYSGSNGSNPQYIAAINNKVFFSANDNVNGPELWKSDGTLVGTSMVKNIEAGVGGSFPTSITNVNDTAYFYATQTGTGEELWKSDGTSAGTVLVKDINPGTGGGAWSWELKNMNGRLYHASQTSASGEEPWISQGTAANTFQLKDVNTTCVGCGSDVNNFTYSNGLTFFGANDMVNGYELWRSNGTSAGTVLVKDIRVGASGGLISYYNNGCFSSCSYNMASANNILFFIADDGTGSGGELWKSDGTAGGTVMVKDIYPGSISSYPDKLINIGGTLFFTANDGTNGVELWKSDGTAGGTVMVKDIYPGSSGSSPSYLTNFGGKLFFAAANDVYGYELWTSMGTSSSTARVSDIYNGAGSSSPKLLTVDGNTLFFVADNGSIGKELWKLDMPTTLTGTGTITNVLCFGQTNGAINLSVSGGTSPYTYAWSNSATTQNISGVAAGVYSVTVSDAWGWTSVSSYTVGTPNTLSVSLSSQHNVTCNTGTNGSVNISVTGGTPSFTYLWSPGGATSQNISSVGFGIYTVVVTDANACTSTYTTNVMQPPALSGTTLINDASCFNSTNGNVTVNMSVGVFPFTYQWSANTGSQTTQTATNLAMGTYSVIVSDDSLCTTTFSAIVNQPTVLSMSLTATSDTCGQADGTVSVVSPSGGTPSYTYSWTTLGAGQTFNGVSSGSYSVTMTDSKGCTKTGSIVVGSVPHKPFGICMVTVDSASTNNIIYWDKTVYTSVDSFIVYREVSTGIYKRVGAQHYSMLSQFTDVNRLIGPANGDPNIGSYRYKLQILDICGNYSLLSPYHNTVYFIDNHTGIFQWNTYLIEGQINTPVVNFNLLRDTLNVGNWINIGTVSGTQTSLNDPKYTTYQSIANWRVEATGFTCTPTMRYGNNATLTAIIRAKSNITNNRTTGTHQLNFNKDEVSVYPNPNNGNFVIETTFTKKQTVQVFDVTGKIVISQIMENGRANINGSDLLQGVYTISISNQVGIVNKKLIIVK